MNFHPMSYQPALLSASRPSSMLFEHFMHETPHTWLAKMMVSNPKTSVRSKMRPPRSHLSPPTLWLARLSLHPNQPSTLHPTSTPTLQASSNMRRNPAPEDERQGKNCFPLRIAASSLSQRRSEHI